MVLVACLMINASAWAKVGKTTMKEGERLFLRIPVELGDISPNTRLTVTPVIANGEKEMRMSPVVISGHIRDRADRRRERLYGESGVAKDTRAEIVVDRHNAPEGLFIDENIAYEKWMGGGQILLLREMSGCAGCRTALEPLVAGEIPMPVMPRIAYLVPDDDAPKLRSERITAVVHFPQGGSVLLPDFAGNRNQLSQIDSLITRLRGNDTLSIELIGIKGYASPEGTYAYNTRLSQERVQSICNYLSENMDIAQESFQLSTVPEDWDSLRQWVAASDWPARERVLAVIDSIADPDARDAAIRAIDAGKTYLRLLNEVYPLLRRVDYTVTYTLPSFTLGDTRRLIRSHPQWLGLREICALALSYPEGSPEREYAFGVAMEYYPDDPHNLNNMAALAIGRGDAAAARECLSGCADDPRVQNNLGIVCLMEGDMEGARRCFVRAAEEGSPQGRFNLSHIGELESEW